MTFRGPSAGGPLFTFITKGDFSHEDLHSHVPHRRRIRDPRNRGATPEQALKKARRLYDDDPFDLMFESYDGGMPVNEIAICGRRPRRACGMARRRHALAQCRA